MSMNMKKTHPQKYYVKLIFKILFYLGLGDCWYEPRGLSPYQNKFYLIWAAISNAYVFLNIGNELLAHFRIDLTDIERNDLVQFSCAHISIAAKIISFYIRKKEITAVFKRLLEETRPIFYSIQLDKASLKQFMRYSLTLVGSSYVTLFGATIYGIRAHFKEDIPIRTEVTFYPKASQSGLLINISRFFVELHWWYIVTIMAAIDCLAVGSLVFVSFKFKLLQLYFNEMGKKFGDPRGVIDRKAVEEEFKNEFIVGVKLHEDALWCAKNVQRALGSVYSVQVFESVSLLVMCLVKLVTVEHSMVFLLSTFFYISCLIVLTGAYMMPAGDITYEASLVSTAIFHSGWESTTARSDIQVLATVAIQRSQVPVFMTAFGVMILSYNNFISVLRSSYSFFAVMY